MRQKPRGDESRVTALQSLVLSDSQRIVLCNVLYKGWHTPDERRSLAGYKPPGMWWGVGKSWIDWCESEMPQWLGRYIYEVKIDDSKLLKIDTIKKFEAFEGEYGVPNIIGDYRFIDSFRGGINWKLVRERYSGIEIAPYFWEKRLNSIWYYGYDVASGVIWNEDALLERTLLYEYNKTSKQYEPHRPNGHSTHLPKRARAVDTATSRLKNVARSHNRGDLV